MDVHQSKLEAERRHKKEERKKQKALLSQAASADDVPSDEYDSKRSKGEAEQ